MIFAGAGAAPGRHWRRHDQAYGEAGNAIHTGMLLDAINSTAGDPTWIPQLAWIKDHGAVLFTVPYHPLR